MVAVVIVIAAALTGLVLGAFARAAVFRFATPLGTGWRSQCPSCGDAVAARAIAARPLPPSGTCRSCRTRIGPPPAAIEAVTAIVFTGLAWRVGPHLELLALAWAGVVSVALAFVDATVHRLPDRLIVAGLVGAAVLFGLSAIVDGQSHAALTAAVCAAAFGAVYFVLVFASPRGLGLGDAKLAVLIGLVTGWFSGFVTVYAGLAGGFLAGVVAVVLLVTRRAGRADHLALGPHMLLGAWIAILLSRA